MLDALGNKLVDGSLVLWKDKDIVCQVMRVVDPADTKIKLVGRDDSAPVPAHLVLQLVIPFAAPENPRDPIVAGSFLMLVNPAAQDAIERMMGSVDRTPQ